MTERPAAGPARKGSIVEIGPFWVLDAPADEVVTQIADLAEAPDAARLVYALHVGGLNHRADAAFVAAMNAADLVYADGGSVVWLARRHGGRHVERAPTTDIGWDVLRLMARRRGRPVRLALVGGPPGLAQRAAEVFDASGWTSTVVHMDGYTDSWSDRLTQLDAADPEVVVVGLGAPMEMVWCQAWRERLPAALILTCGGWFGHVTGDEVRAPRLLRRSGLEWIARLWQQPRRLGPRYARGFVSTLVLARSRREGRA